MSDKPSKPTITHRLQYRIRDDGALVKRSFVGELRRE